MINRRDLLRQIQELDFAALDLNLYLDTHPNCQKALMDFNMISQQLNKAKRIYEMNFGPLTNFGYSSSKFPWQWVNEPWPWEIQ